MRNFLSKLKPWQAFKTFAILFSFTVNFVLIIVLLVVAPLILPIVGDIAVPIVGGLNQSFEDMGDATIVRTIEVKDEIPISFTLPLEESTIVTTTAVVELNEPATFILPGNGGLIRGQVELDLPMQLALPVELKLDVPVDQQVPVELLVDVEIPLDETELGQPFGQLQALFTPLDRLLRGLPGSNQELFDRFSASSPEETEIPAADAPAAP